MIEETSGRPLTTLKHFVEFAVKAVDEFMARCAVDIASESSTDNKGLLSNSAMLSRVKQNKATLIGRLASTMGYGEKI